MPSSPSRLHFHHLKLGFAEHNPQLHSLVITQKNDDYLPFQPMAVLSISLWPADDSPILPPINSED